MNIGKRTTGSARCTDTATVYDFIKGQLQFAGDPDAFLAAVKISTKGQQKLGGNPTPIFYPHQISSASREL
jgi:hypothetical protein